MDRTSSRIDTGVDSRLGKGASLFVVTALFLVLLGGGLTRADEVKIGQLKYANVRILKFADGKIHFTAAGGNLVKMDIRDLRGLKLKEFPELKFAEEFFEDKEYKLAYNTYKKLYSKARVTWLKQWLNYRLVKCTDRLEMAEMSIKTYLTLAKSNADQYFLRSQPQDSLSKITKAQQKQFIALVASGIKQARNAKTRELLKQLKLTLESLEFGGPKKPLVDVNGTHKKTTYGVRRPSKVLFVTKLDDPEFDSNYFYYQ